MPAKTVIALAFTATAAAGIAAGTALASADSALRVPVVAATETPTAPPEGTQPAAPAITPDQAMTKANEKVSGKIAATELDDESQPPSWKVTVVTDDDKWHEVTVDGTSGEVTGDQETDGDSDEAKKIRDAKVTAADAVKKATETQPGTLESVDFGDEGDKPVWDVTVKADDGAEHELQVPADDANATATPSPTST
ncbi:PepSY domain-containing protein [Actinocorallia sp. A-T 12471]|uniref:PepSY domain-containing protein n=1 Tax=Actinocorallia sp. A-T 12471 TaxID=3089813 RepID=UPI0029CC29D7|nr:PepSY domain-containing protein [Actinocorallia sp. A-T 12471]MDX6739601.1 PepSY domain-containing protein [Actinocorallia sp. A-T 12471]